MAGVTLANGKSVSFFYVSYVGLKNVYLFFYTIKKDALYVSIICILSTFEDSATTIMPNLQYSKGDKNFRI